MRKLLLVPLLAAMVLIPAPSLARPLKMPPAQASDTDEVRIISTKALKAKLDQHEHVTLVEALEPKFYSKGHLPGAIRMTDPEQYASKLLPDKKAEIVVYCMNTY